MPKSVTRPIALTMGEPAGIGGEIALAAWQRRSADKVPPFVLIDSPERLQLLCATLNWDIPIQPVAQVGDAMEIFPRALPVLPIAPPVTSAPGVPDTANAAAVLHAISTAVDLARAGDASGVVTNPIHKGVLYQAGFHHPGHTEYLAELGGVDRTVMMLVGGGLRAVPVTVHQSLRDAIDGLTTAGLVETCRIVAHDLRRWFGFAQPRLAMAGLNPHAGESGAMGMEEKTILAPALAALRDEGIAITGPHPADTMFHAEARAQYDVAICMYHDQALIPVKTLDFHGGVNVTLGLPFIRTSPDHGTAFNLAGNGAARPDSLIAALKLASTMAESQSRTAG